MATLKFFLQSDKPNSTIYCSFSIGRNQVFKRKTREVINPEKWNSKNGLPIQVKNHSLNKDDHKSLSELENRLVKLRSFVLDQHYLKKENEIINGDWLNEIISAYYNDGVRTIDLDYIDNYLQHYLNIILPFRKYRGKPISERTKVKQEIIISKLLDFLKTEKTRLKVSDYNVAVGNRFVVFLRSQNLAENTVGKYLKYTKTIFKSAINENIAVSNQLDEIKGFKVETPTPYLTKSELDSISNLKLVGDKLELARDWLIIGCYTGQRASDFFAMNKNKFITINGKEFISVTQQKTKTTVSVPIKKQVREVLNKYNGDFPPQFSINTESAKTIFNRHLKIVCKLANIDRVEFGRVYDNIEKKYIFGNYPFYEIISSHICRRTFATMHYSKVSTPIIMSITGHKTEEEFLGYCGIDGTTLSEQMYNYWDNEIDEETADKNTANVKKVFKTAN